MSSTVANALLVLFFLLLGAFFAGSEIALEYGPPWPSSTPATFAFPASAAASSASSASGGSANSASAGSASTSGTSSAAGK